MFRLEVELGHDARLVSEEGLVELLDGADHLLVADGVLGGAEHEHGIVAQVGRRVDVTRTLEVARLAHEVVHVGSASDGVHAAVLGSHKVVLGAVIGTLTHNTSTATQCHEKTAAARHSPQRGWRCR